MGRLQAKSLSQGPNWAIYAGISLLARSLRTRRMLVCGVYNGATSAIYVDNSQPLPPSGNVGAVRCPQLKESAHRLDHLPI